MYAGRGYRRPLTGSTFGFSLSRKGSGKFYPIFSDPYVLGLREGKGARDIFAIARQRAHIQTRARFEPPRTGHFFCFRPVSPVHSAPLVTADFRRNSEPTSGVPSCVRTNAVKLTMLYSNFGAGRALAIRFAGR